MPVRRGSIRYHTELTGVGTGRDPVRLDLFPLEERFPEGSPFGEATTLGLDYPEGKGCCTPHRNPSEVLDKGIRPAVSSCL